MKELLLSVGRRRLWSAVRQGRMAEQSSVGRRKCVSFFTYLILPYPTLSYPIIHCSVHPSYLILLHGVVSPPFVLYLGMSGCGLSLGQTLTYVTDFISHTTVQHYSAKASVLKCMPTAVQ